MSEVMNLPRVAQSFDFTCGAACFASMMQYLQLSTRGEVAYAKELGTFDLGYTPPENIVFLAKKYGLSCEMEEGAELQNISELFDKGAVIFVTWWDEDAGHYSLVKHLDDRHILLMDPWTARLDQDNEIPIERFTINWKLRGARLIGVVLGVG